jgi:hypothetical protein
MYSGGNSRRWLGTAVDDSLTRLQTDWIDLYQVHRPRPRHRHRRNPRRTHRSRSGRQDPGVRLLNIPCRTDCASPARRRAARAASVPLRATALLDAGPWRRGGGAAGMPAVRPRCAGVEPARLRVLSGRVRGDQPVEQTMHRVRVQPGRFDLSRPENLTKLDAAEQLTEVAARIGCSLPQLAVPPLRRRPPPRPHSGLSSPGPQGRPASRR